MTRSTFGTRSVAALPRGTVRRHRQGSSVLPLTERVKARQALEGLFLRALADGRRSATQRGIPKRTRAAKLAEIESALLDAKESA